MIFDQPLIPATLIRRYKRFLCDVILPDGKEVVAHIANPGSMLGLQEVGQRIWVEPNDNPKRKLKYTWRLTELADGTLINVDTSLANKVAAEALHGGLAEKLGYTQIKPEIKYGEGSRVDFLLSDPTTTNVSTCYLEIKSVTLSRNQGLAEFPDSITKRGAKHLQELANMVRLGSRAILLYMIQRDDIQGFDIAKDIDPNYAIMCQLAQDVGVEILCYRTKISTKGIWLGRLL